MKSSRKTNQAGALATLVAVAATAGAHPGHRPDIGRAADVIQASATVDDARVTGSGDLRFRVNRELSELPEEIAAGIAKAHGGFAKAPDGTVYFGLEGTGLVRVSADLATKTLLSNDPTLCIGALHNATYVDRDATPKGGLIVLPDCNTGRLHVRRTDGTAWKTLGRPSGQVDPYYADLENGYKPTDTEVGPDGALYVTDGYSESKFVLKADLDRAEYVSHVFGENINGQPRAPGKFSTAHGITLDPGDETLVVADRERQWAQRFTLDGEFVGGIDTAGANPCDVDFVTWGGEPLLVIGCLRGPNNTAGVVQLVRGDRVVATLRPQADLGLGEFEHIHNAMGVVVDERLYVLCYGWNPGCYAVLEHVAE